MTAPLSQDLRERNVRVVADGSSIRQAAERFQVSSSAAIKLMQRVRQTGRTAPAKVGGYRRPLVAGLRRTGLIAPCVGAAPEGRRQNTRRVVEHHRSAARRLHLGRVPELHPQLRL
jgi:hypothetical protein